MKFAPRPYQKLAAEFMLDTPRCNVWAAMGLGKTSSTLSALSMLRIAAEQRAREKEAELRRQAAEANAAERAKIEAKMQAEADKAAAKQAELDARAASVTAPVIHREAPKVEGLSTRTVWKFRITDARKLPPEYTVPDEVKIRKVVQALKGDTQIPGVEVYAEETMASRAASF